MVSIIRMVDYGKLAKAVVKTIRTKGIPVYIERFNRLYNDDHAPETFATEAEFLDYISTVVHYYHPHSFLDKRDDDASTAVSKKTHKTNKPTCFTFGSDKIGKIQLFSFSSHNGPAAYEREKKKYVDEINEFLDMATEHGMKGLIIDFSKHGGGGIWQTVDAFKRYFNNTTLFAWGNSKAGLDEKKWTNMENGRLVWNRRFFDQRPEHGYTYCCYRGESHGFSGRDRCCDV